MSNMKITFYRESERRYRTEIVRDDGVALRVPAYDRTSVLPHDIAHVAVEGALRLGCGFWGTVADGGQFSGMTVISGRQRPHATERSKAVIRANHEKIIEAEVLVTEFMKLVSARINPASPTAMAILNKRWKPRHPEVSEFSQDQIARICAALLRARSKWESLKIGECFSMEWKPARRLD